MQKYFIKNLINKLAYYYTLKVKTYFLPLLVPLTFFLHINANRKVKLKFQAITLNFISYTVCVCMNTLMISDREAFPIILFLPQSNEIKFIFIQTNSWW